jgi:hypothetical protein
MIWDWKNTTSCVLLGSTTLGATYSAVHAGGTVEFNSLGTPAVALVKVAMADRGSCGASDRRPGAPMPQVRPSSSAAAKNAASVTSETQQSPNLVFKC